MAKLMRIKKGLTLNLVGKAPEVELEPLAMSSTYAVSPDDFQGFMPKLLVKVGDVVKQGEPIMYHKRSPEMKLTAPVSGEVVAVSRGAKRKILSVEIRQMVGEEIVYKTPQTADEIRSALLESGMWALLRQRPYSIVPDPSVRPRDVFVTANFTAPLHPSFAQLSVGREKELQAALSALAKLTDGKVYVGVPAGELTELKDVERIEVSGPHPAGLVGTLINHIAPVNKNELVWTANASDLLTIGRFLLTGRVDYSRRIALAGSEAYERGFVQIVPGARISDVFASRLTNGNDEHKRVIAGDVLTGRRISDVSPFFPAGCDMITVIPEGDDVNEFVGWATPGFGKFSMNRSFFSWLTPNKEYVFDARVKGGERAMIMSGEYQRVFAMDILAEYLLKAIIAFDITKMENLGIYEVAPEDFALCEFVDTSKIEIQRIVRQGLDELYKEMN